MTIINLSAERDKRNGPDKAHTRLDDEGRILYEYALDYRMDDAHWSASIWAYSMEDAERRVSAMRHSLTLSGQVYTGM